MVLKQIRAGCLNGHEGHVFKFSALVVFMVNKLTISTVVSFFL